MFKRILSVLGLMVPLCCLVQAQDFGIAGWTYDPITIATRCTGHSNCERQIRLANVQGAMESMLTWCDEMGYQRLMVDYDDSSYFDYFSGHQVKAINTLRPGIVDSLFMSRQKTIQAQWPNWIDRDLRGAFAKNTTTRVTIDGHNMDKMQQQNPDTMWYPSNHSNFRGWGDGVYMPVHFRITCAARVDSSAMDSFPNVATIYWFVRDEVLGEIGTDKDGEEAFTISRYSSGTWTRYPAIILPASSFLGHDREVMTFDFTIDPKPESNLEFRKVIGDGENWQLVQDVDSSHSFSRWHPVRVGVNYLGGNHEFNLESVEIWDDDFNRMCKTRDPVMAQSIADEYYDEYQGHEDTHYGWMFDDFLSDVIQPMARIMEIVHDDPRGMPGFYSSSFNTWFQRFYAILDEHNTPRPTQCNEQYWLGGDGICRGQGAWENPLSFLLTDSTSDTPYLTLTQSDTCPFCPYGSGMRSRRGVNGHESLQFALDQGVWGEGSYSEELNTMYPGFTNNWQASGGMITEIDSVHAKREKYWALLQSGRWGTFGINDCGDNYWARYPIREPSPNEVKLQAWMAVACDADGIMWYGTLSYSNENPEMSPLGHFYSGFFEWGNGTPDPWPGRDNFCGGPHQVYRTPRYDAGKDVLREIMSIAPTLMSLDFVRTYASRAFGHSYSGAQASIEAVRTDSLDDPEVLRRVASIDAHVWSTQQNNWITSPEPNEYVQVSRFQSPNVALGSEDYWFLIVNRRALSNERRKVRLWIDGVDGNSIWQSDAILSGISDIADSTYGSSCFNCKVFQIALEPGEAELVHFYKQDTTDIVITTPTVITAPAVYTRNIVLRDSGSLTIVPDISRIHTGDSVASITFCDNKGIKILSKGKNPCRLSIQGNDSVRIRLQSTSTLLSALPTPQQWSGISGQIRQGDSITLKNIEINSASVGLQITSNTGDKFGGNCMLSNCRFIRNTTGLIADSKLILSAEDCRFTGNWEGLLIQNGAHATLTDCEIDSSRFRSLIALTCATVNLENVMIHDNGTDASADSTLSMVLSLNSDLRMKCSRIYSNKGVGLEVIGGSLIMADNSLSPTGPLWGGNQIAFNTGIELICRGLTGGFLFVNGHNQVWDSSATQGHKGKWIWCPPIGISTRLDYRGNYWGGADSLTISNHIKPVVPFIPVFASSQFCDLSNEEGGTNDCYVQAVKEEVLSAYADAKEAYKNIIKDTTDCGKKAALNRLTSVDFLGGFDNDSTRDYLSAIADTMTDDELKHAANMSIAFTLIKSEAYDSAKVMYQTILANASDSLDRVIDGMSGLLLLDMAKRMADTNRVGLTAEELTAYMKGLDHILKGDFTWTNYSITDSVVMYAPCRVEGAIWIQQNGALTILPLPGMDDPVVSFGPAGRITVDSKWQTYMPAGKLYVRGTAEQPVTLEWADSTTSTNIYNMGYMDLKHAVLRGKGFVCDNERAASPPVLRADSCSILSFDEGLWLGGADSCSYLKNCLIEGVGRPEYINYWGSSILIYDNTGPITIENCDIRNSGDVGILSCYNWAGVNIKNTRITGSKNYGILTMEFADMRLECNQLSDNGDSIPEMWVDGGLVDLVGSRNEFADSTGSLIYSADPSYVDLEDGENSFSLLTQNGRYLQSADTSSVWNITMNAWSPVEPTDSTFYNYLYPNNAANWTVDSSLADFVACGMGEAMSINVLTQGEASDNERGSGTMSVDEGGDLNLSTDIARPNKANDTKLSKAQSTDKQAIASKKSTATKRAKQADAKKLHQEELTKWREVKELSKSGNKVMAMEAGLKFLNEHSGSELVPAALISLANLTRGDGRTLGISDNLMKKSKELPFKKDRTLAKRLAYRVKAEEGNPAEALAGLEEMMDNSDSPQDSIRALVDAMGVHFFNKHQTNLHPSHESVVNADIPALKHRMIELSQLLTNPDQIPSGRGALIPTKYMLYQNYPNPFNPTTEIKFDLPEAVKVELRVFNILGQEVATLINDLRPAGAYRVFWDSKNSGGSSVASGVYVYQIKAGNFTSAKKMVLMR